MKLIALLLASVEATKLGWNNGQYVPWTPPAGQNDGSYTPWVAPATQNNGQWVDDTANYDWSNWGNDWDSSATVEVDHPALVIPEADDWIDTNWQNDQPWMNEEPAVDEPNTEEPNTEASEMIIPDAQEWINTSWQNDQPWNNEDGDADDSDLTPDITVTDEDFDIVLYGDEVDGEFDDAEAWYDSITDEDMTGDISIDEPEDEVCENTDNGITDDYGDDCEDYAENLDWCGFWDTEDFHSMEMCCACKDLDPAFSFDEDTCEDDLSVTDVYGDDCSDYAENTHWCGVYDYYGDSHYD